MRTLRWSFVLAVLMASFATEAGAMLDPHTLLMLTHRSELIITAKVEKVTLIERENGHSTGTARLNILSVVKGTVESQSIDLFYSPDIVCPEPPHYVEGATVLAFLRRFQGGSGYFVVGDSFGVKSLTDREIEAHLASIRELFKIEEDADQNAGLRRLVEWILRRAEDPANSWEGAFDLRQLHYRYLSARGYLHYRYLPNLEGNVDFSALLTEEQKNKLAAILYHSTPSFSGTVLVELGALLGDENLGSLLWTHLKAANDNSIWGAWHPMRKLAILLKNQEAWELTEKYDQDTYRMKFDEEKKAIVRRFIKAVERAGAPRPFEIKNEPEKPADPPRPAEIKNEPEKPIGQPLQQSAKGGIGLRGTLLAFAILLVAVIAIRRR